jgi:hypothetical protein
MLLLHSGLVHFLFSNVGPLSVPCRAMEARPYTTLACVWLLGVGYNYSALSFLVRPPTLCGNHFFQVSLSFRFHFLLVGLYPSRRLLSCPTFPRRQQSGRGENLSSFPLVLGGPPVFSWLAFFSSRLVFISASILASSLSCLVFISASRDYIICFISVVWRYTINKIPLSHFWHLFWRVGD